MTNSLFKVYSFALETTRWFGYFCNEFRHVLTIFVTRVISITILVFSVFAISYRSRTPFRHPHVIHMELEKEKTSSYFQSVYTTIGYAMRCVIRNRVVSCQEWLVLAMTVLPSLSNL